MNWFDRNSSKRVALRHCEDILGSKSGKVLNEKGQLTIFLGIILVIVMGLLAFIINVGLFVKAKINLQNAVDAAAFSGASVQSRQLTNIAYLNWEMRNTYKEWMFKYYVLGQLGFMGKKPDGSDGNLQGTNLAGAAGTPAKFLLYNPAIANYSTFDKFNIPSICIHNSSGRNICPLFALPGLPRFQAVNIAGLSEIHEKFVNSLVQEKANNCSQRSQINYITATSWAYSTGVDIPGAPLIAGGRIGAWPQAIELAMRMRNLEMIVNRPPVSEGIDFQKINELQATGSIIGLNERPIKAFISAYRNLGGGKYKDQKLDELSGTFKLFEVPPSPYEIGNMNASTFLIPENAVYPGTGVKVTTKNYLDLKAYTINFASMYSAFVSTNENFDSGTKSDAVCGVSKTALPVPGYIMGFVKNPEMLTYYAVRGEAKFIGLFFPFTKSDGITLKAYAAAKPFGGRIGPQLFKFENNSQSVKPREDAQKRSASFISAFSDSDLTISNTYVKGDPIPNNRNFWADSNENIGGIPGTGEKTYFTIPNMIYDFENYAELAAQTTSLDNIQKIVPVNDPGPSAIPKEHMGLHDRSQMRLLIKNTLGALGNATLSSAQVDLAIARARMPTKYDAINYLIPDFSKIQRDDTNSPQFIVPMAEIAPNVFTYQLFAPLLGDGLLFQSPAEVESVIKKYLQSNADAVNTFLNGLYAVASAVKKDSSAGDPDIGLKAALTIHEGVRSGNPIPPDLNPADCKLDIASRFNHFFKKDTPVCGIEPLPYMISTYLAKKSSGSASTANLYYQATYYPNPALDVYSAYFPGPRQGTDAINDGSTKHPLQLSGMSSAEYSTRRNSYSTKFVSMAKLVREGVNDYEEEPPLREELLASPIDLPKANIQNLIMPSELSEFKTLDH